MGEDFDIRICSNCNEIITEDVENCTRCNASLKKGGDDAVSDFLKYLGVDQDADDFAKQHLIKEDERVGVLRNRLASLSALIDKTEGSEDESDILREAVELYQIAKQALDEKDLEHAEDMLEKSVDKVNQCSLQYRVLQDTFKTTRKKIAEADEMAGDVTQPNKLMDKAMEMMMELKYDMAISMAIKAGMIAQKELS